MAKVHFEDLWDKAEKANSFDDLGGQEVLAKISSTLEELRDIYKVSATSKDRSLISEMKSKAMGRLLINIANLSKKENIDVYASLKDQLDILDLRDKITF